MGFKFFKRLFNRGIYGTGDNSTNKEYYRVDRTLNKDGTSYKVTIPPDTVKDLRLYQGVVLERKGNKVIITGKEIKHE